jgi:hypothetical protein
VAAQRIRPSTTEREPGFSRAPTTSSARRRPTVSHATNAFVHGVSLALLAGAAALLAGAAFVAVRAPGRTESQANAGLAVPGLTPAEARAASPSGSRSVGSTVTSSM